MTRRLYIHVGPRKTATSTIQRCLASHDNSVVLYPRTGLGLGGPGQAHGHHGLVFGFFEERGNALLESFAAECNQSRRNILVSAEILENKDMGAFVKTLLDRVNNVEHVEFLFACREHFARAASMYNHRARRRNSDDCRLPDEFLAKSAAEVCYAPLVQDLRRTGFAITALNYHPSSDWVERFLTHIGFGKDGMPPIENDLVAFSPKMLVAHLALKAIPSRERRRTVRKAVDHMGDSSVPLGFIFGPDAAEQAERQFAVDRQFLKDEFGIELVPPSLESRESGLRIGTEELADIVAVAKDFGEDGQAVVDFASRFVR